jgi:predicted NBD/HSP70 family sugar kinase
MKHGCAIGIDIGGTHSKLGVVDASGAVHHAWKMPTEAHGSSPEPYLDQLVREIQALLNKVYSTRA